MSAKKKPSWADFSAEEQLALVTSVVDAFEETRKAYGWTKTKVNAWLRQMMSGKYPRYERWVNTKRMTIFTYQHLSELLPEFNKEEVKLWAAPGEALNGELPGQRHIPMTQDDIRSIVEENRHYKKVNSILQSTIDNHEATKKKMEKEIRDLKKQVDGFLSEMVELQADSIETLKNLLVQNNKFHKEQQELVTKAFNDLRPHV